MDLDRGKRVVRGSKPWASRRTPLRQSFPPRVLAYAARPRLQRPHAAGRPRRQAERAQTGRPIANATVHFTSEFAPQRRTATSIRRSGAANGRRMASPTPPGWPRPRHARPVARAGDVGDHTRSLRLSLRRRRCRESKAEGGDAHAERVGFESPWVSWRLSLMPQRSYRWQDLAAALLRSRVAGPSHLRIPRPHR
jgi:hypothetical protein